MKTASRYMNALMDALSVPPTQRTSSMVQTALNSNNEDTLNNKKRKLRKSRNRIAKLSRRANRNK